MQHFAEVAAYIDLADFCKRPVATRRTGSVRTGAMPCQSGGTKCWWLWILSGAAGVGERRSWSSPCLTSGPVKEKELVGFGDGETVMGAQVLFGDPKGWAWVVAGGSGG